MPVAPPDAVIDRKRWPGRRFVLVLPVFVALAWLVDRWDLGGFFVPGQAAGAVVSNLVGAVLLTRWQRTHGGEVLVRRDGDEPELYRM